MSVVKFTLLASSLIGFSAVAQSDEPDCSAPRSYIFEACRTNTSNVEFGATAEFRSAPSTGESPQPEQAAEALRWADFARGTEFEMQQESPVVSEDIITITLSDGQRVPYVEIKREDGSIVERSPTLAETAAWRDAYALNPEIQRMPASRAARYESQAASDNSEFSLESGNQSAPTPDYNPSRSELEDMMDIPESHRGRDGMQCSEYESPDGSTQSSSCSQTWSWSSSD